MSKADMRLLVEAALGEMGRNGATADHIRRYRKTGFGEILLHFQQIGQEEYSASAVDEFVSRTRCEYERGATSRWKWGMVYRGAALLKQFHDYGTLDSERNPQWTVRQLSAYFAGLVEQYCDDTLRIGALRESTVMLTKNKARQLLFEFEDIGMLSFDGITPRVANECVVRIAGRHEGGMASLLVCLRRFLGYLHSTGITGLDLGKSLPELAAPRRPIHNGFSDDEAASILAAANLSTAIGKRDFAIMLLASQTGLRGCDIISLKREDIDWRTKEIRLAQSKTGVILTLPLPVKAGNAIADYLLNARPKCDDPHIFLTTDTPYRRLKKPIGIVPRHIRRAGIAGKVAARSGLHSFRRAFGKSLLESEVSLDTLSELFGHTDMDSIKPYLAVNESGLKKCALPLIPAKIGGDLA